MRSGRFRGTCVAVALIFFLTPAAMAEDVIKIGVAGPHTGDLASYGIPSLKATEIVVKDFNAKGGLLGRKIEILKGDDVCKPEIATNVATKLVSEGAVAVIGHICSGATKPAVAIYKEAKLVCISPSATNPALTQSGEYSNFFRTIASDDAQAKLDVDFATDVLKLKKLAVLHDKGDYGKGLAEYAKTFIEAGKKAELVLFEGITPGALDYSAIVQKIKDSGAEGVIYGGYHPEASKIVKQMRDKAMKSYFISDDGVKDDTFIKVAGEFAEGVYATGPKDITQNPMAVKALGELKAEYNEDKPGAFFYEGYSAALALLTAILKAGSTDYDKVVKALRSEYVETPVGRIKFDARGDAEGVGFAMYQVQKGVYVEVK